MAYAEPALLEVEVAYSPEPRRVDITALTVPQGSTVSQAVEASGLLQRHPSAMGSGLKLAVWGRLVDADTAVRAGDRVEVLRALRVDPKEARRQRYRRQADRRPKSKR